MEVFIMFGITPYSTYRGGYNPFRELEKLEGM